ncbi:MAG: hypothetical protein SGJ27_02160 [Candidatus Melainabacteria bacterium]|nr:hypothetical protein [Candidatus Melainabacteria bacterium]
MPDTDTPIYSATKIVDTIKRDDTFDAQVYLAVDYMSMSPKDFKSVVTEMQTAAKKSGIHNIYDNDSKGQIDLYLDDTFVDDTNLLRVNRNIAPKSEPLDDPKLERAAVNFNKLLGVYTNTDSKQKYKTQYAAGAALAEYGSRLSPADEVKLLNRAEEINMEFFDSERPKLRVSTRGAHDVKDLVFEFPINSTGRLDVTYRKNLMRDRTFRK